MTGAEKGEKRSGGGGDWQRMATYSEPRLSEMVEMYESIGYEVRLEEVDTGSEECAECMKAAPDDYRTIYVRKA